MSKIYVVMAQRGEYSDFSEEPVAAYVRKEEAEEHARRAAEGGPDHYRREEERVSAWNAAHPFPRIEDFQTRDEYQAASGKRLEDWRAAQEEHGFYKSHPLYGGAYRSDDWVVWEIDVLDVVPAGASGR